ncbi:MAG TPA: SMP-30/gluconolactonase/LRE family protein [Opitutaceae bacterium]|nr:SMP-30/gluconolactonase/LRE family protein [Opitutaceae bacterium]
MKPLIPFFLLAGSALMAVAAEPFGRIERFDPALDHLLAPDAAMEKIADGIQWAEGPVWYHGALVFSDPPANIARRWAPGDAKPAVFLQPSGWDAPAPGFREPGSNGLAVDRQGRLLLCQDGARRIARYENGRFVTLADRYDGKRFSSPNDLAVRRNGDIYFTDPTYGLDRGNQSPLRELPFNGVYRLAADGTVTLLIKDLTYPNGIAFSPDEQVLYVNVSDSADTRIMAYDVQADGSVSHGRRFFDASGPELRGSRGVFDGLKVDRKGDLWTSAPGNGIVIVSPRGKLLGKLSTGVPTANCAWGDDGSTLYITANHYILRLKTLTKGAD